VFDSHRGPAQPQRRTIILRLPGDGNPGSGSIRGLAQLPQVEQAHGTIGRSRRAYRWSPSALGGRHHLSRGRTAGRPHRHPAQNRVHEL